MKLGLSLAASGALPLDFIGVGEGGLDLLCLAQSLPEPDRKQRLLDMRRLPGGQAASAAVGCARLGWRSRYVGAIGDDAAGVELTESLRKEGVDLRLVTRNGVPTRTAVVLVSDGSGQRSILEYRDQRLDIRPDEIDPAAFFGRVVLVDATDIGLAARAAAVSRTAGARTLVDIDAPVERASELLALIDVVIVPASFVLAFTGQREVGAGLAEMGRGLPAAAVVATLGADGALAWCRGTEVRVKAAPGSVVDTTGAGDAFRAGFASAWLDVAGQDPDLNVLLEVASLAAALNCRAVGAQTGLPTRKELVFPRQDPV